MAERKSVSTVRKHAGVSYVAQATEDGLEAASRSRPKGRRKRRIVREPLSTRIRVTLRELMDDYEDETGMGVQATVEAALTEFLKKKGYKEP